MIDMTQEEIENFINGGLYSEQDIYDLWFEVQRLKGLLKESKDDIILPFHFAFSYVYLNDNYARWNEEERMFEVNWNRSDYTLKYEEDYVKRMISNGEWEVKPLDEFWFQLRDTEAYYKAIKQEDGYYVKGSSQVEIMQEDRVKENILTKKWKVFV